MSKTKLSSAPPILKHGGGGVDFADHIPIEWNPEECTQMTVMNYLHNCLGTSGRVQNSTSNKSYIGDNLQKVVRVQTHYIACKLESTLEKSAKVNARKQCRKWRVWEYTSSKQTVTERAH